VNQLRSGAPGAHRRPTLPEIRGGTGPQGLRESWEASHGWSSIASNRPNATVLRSLHALPVDHRWDRVPG
jgi:hypothetical protein